MKTNLILTVITILSLGALALVRSQDDAQSPTEAPETTPAETETAETSASPAGIRTDVVVEQKLLGGEDAVTVIPVASVFAEGERFLVLAKGAESDIDFRETEVTLGKTDGLLVEVVDGLFPGDEVITVSVNQLRFPAFDNGNGEFCGVGGCGPVHCDSVTGDCSAKGGKGAVCETGQACADGETCEIGTVCADGTNCAPDTEFTLSADEFFNGTVEEFFEPAPFVGRPPMFFPY